MRLRSDSEVSIVKDWVAGLPDSPDILDLGCGHGQPLSPVLINTGGTLHALDASPTMVAAYSQTFPDIPIRCEPVESIDFFGRRFDGILAIGLMFLLPEKEQRQLINTVAKHLKSSGQFLFSSPRQRCDWRDVQTGQMSRSLGIRAYTECLEEAGMRVIGDAEDEGGNFYLVASKP